MEATSAHEAQAGGSERTAACGMFRPCAPLLANADRPCNSRMTHYAGSTHFKRNGVPDGVRNGTFGMSAYVAQNSPARVSITRAPAPSAKR